MVKTTKGGAAFIDGASYETRVVGSGAQQLDYLKNQAFGPSNPSSSLLPANPSVCMTGGKSHRKKKAKKSHKKAKKSHKKRKQRATKRVRR